jgi:hypothetical protein
MSSRLGALVVAGAIGATLVAAAGAPRPAAAQGQPVGTAQNAIGTLVIVRTDGIEHRLQGKGSLPLYEGDVLRTEPASQALIQLRPGAPVALNEKTTVKILSRWDKSVPGPGTVRILRVSRGEDGQTALTVVQGTADFGTPFGQCAVRSGTTSVGARGAACTAPQAANAAAAIGWKQAVSQ